MATKKITPWGPAISVTEVAEGIEIIDIDENGDDNADFMQRVAKLSAARQHEIAQISLLRLFSDGPYLRDGCQLSLLCLRYPESFHASDVWSAVRSVRQHCERAVNDDFWATPFGANCQRIHDEYDRLWNSHFHPIGLIHGRLFPTSTIFIRPLDGKKMLVFGESHITRNEPIDDELMQDLVNVHTAVDYDSLGIVDAVDVT